MPSCGRCRGAGSGSGRTRSGEAALGRPLGAGRSRCRPWSVYRLDGADARRRRRRRRAQCRDAVRHLARRAPLRGARNVRLGARRAKDIQMPLRSRLCDRPARRALRNRRNVPSLVACGGRDVSAGLASRAKARFHARRQPGRRLRRAVPCARGSRGEHRHERAAFRSRRGRRR